MQSHLNESWDSGKVSMALSLNKIDTDQCADEEESAFDDNLKMMDSNFKLKTRYSLEPLLIYKFLHLLLSFIYSNSKHI